MLKSAFAAVFLLLFFIPVFAQAQQLNPDSQLPYFGVDAGAAIPLFDSGKFFTPGYFTELTGSFNSGTPVDLSFVAGYERLPLIAGPKLDLGRLEMGWGYTQSLGPKFALKGTLKAGGFFAAINNSTEFNNLPVTSSFGGSAAAAFSLKFTGIKKMEIELGSRFRYLLGLWSGIEGSLGVNFRLGAEKIKPVTKDPIVIPFNTGGLKVDPVGFKPVFPVFYSYYDDHPFGTSLITNSGSGTITDVRVSFYMKDFMDEPKECALIPRLVSGETIPLQILGLFSSKMMEITKETWASGTMSVSYLEDGQVVRMERSETVRILDRNAMSWFDDHCPVAFITANDPSVLAFTKNVLESVTPNLNGKVNRNLQVALALHDALDLYGMKFTTDPKTSYATVARNPEVIYRIQYPRETLEKLEGDCDDLSILYASLLEATGIETAFITVPGRMFVAFSLAITPDEAAVSFAHPEDLIIRGKQVWLPVEITDRSKGFMSAWQTGARLRRENLSTKASFFYPVHEGFAVFDTVILPASGLPVPSLDSNLIKKAYIDEMDKLTENEISYMVSDIQKEILRSPFSSKPVNALGVLYAKNGLTAKAELEFLKALKLGQSLPVLLNLGSLYNMSGNLETARVYFERAYRFSPSNSVALLNYACVNYILDNYLLSKRLYDDLKRQDPDLAGKFPELEATGDMDSKTMVVKKQKEMMVWAE